MCKKIFIIIFLIALGIGAFAQQFGYEVKVQFKQPIKDKYITLAHYFAKPLPTIYKTDSVKVVNNTATFKSKDSILGGIYLVLFDDNSKYVELLLDNGNKFSMIIDTTDLPASVQFTNSSMNQAFLNYQELMHTNRTNINTLTQAQKGSNISDSILINEKIKKEYSRFKTERQLMLNKYPHTLVSNIINSFMNPEIPEGVKYIANTEVIDTLYDYYYFKNHYWDKFDFTDNRLAHTPLLDYKIDQYFKYVMPIPDSFIKEADFLLDQSRNAKELFKYFLHWMTSYTYSSKVMGMDEAFVHLITNYHMKGDAYWLEEKQLQKYIQEAQKIAPNMIGMKGKDIPLVDLFTLKPFNLYDLQAPYTVLVIWKPDCGHCQTEIPKLDSVYNAYLKQYGTKIFSVPLSESLEEIQKFVKEHHLEQWQNSIDIGGKSNVQENYDAYATPKMYLLDENKMIVGKNLDHSNIEGLIQFLERKKNNAKRK